jgi:hypothetical protein
MANKGRLLLSLLCGVTVIAFVSNSVIGCSSDDAEEALDNLNGNGNTNGTTTAGDVAKLVLVGQGGVAILPNGLAELPKEVAVGTPVVLAVVAYDKSNNVITGDALVPIYSGTTWKSSDEAVASITVNPAMAGAVILTTKKAGKVKITATYKGISASAELTVK